MAGRLAGKVMIITGAANGQGRAVAEFFAREGARAEDRPTGGHERDLYVLRCHASKTNS